VHKGFCIKLPLGLWFLVWNFERHQVSLFLKVSVLGAAWLTNGYH